MTWHRDRRTYFFSGDRYWRFGNESKGFAAGYPKRIKDGWKDLPKRIDAAFSSNKQKKTFFVSGNKFYLFDD